MYVYKADVVRVLDGDTVELLVDLGFGVKININLRLAFIDTAETWRPKSPAEKLHGMEATARLTELIACQDNAKETFANEHYEEALNSVIVRSSKHGKYRWVGELFPYCAIHSNNLDDFKSFNQILIDEGYEKKDIYPDSVF